jgi:hypothetical protein
MCGSARSGRAERRLSQDLDLTPDLYVDGLVGLAFADDFDAQSAHLPVERAALRLNLLAPLLYEINHLGAETGPVGGDVPVEDIDALRD